jgi:hypothetical protein
LLILLAVVVGGLLWLLAGPMLQAVDGGSGYTLFSAQSGPIVATLVMALLGLPIVALGLAISASGHPLSGVFAVGTALCFLAGSGGAVDGWLLRAADHDALPQSYGILIGETLIWQLGVVLMLTGIALLRSPLRARWPALAYDDHLGVDIHIRLPQMQAVIAGAMCTVVAGIIAFIFIRSSDTAQVMGSLIFAFTVGGCVAHLAFPHSNPVGIVLSPAILSILAYAWMMVGGHLATTSSVMEMWFALRYRVPLPGGLAMALPIHYISAGIVGCTLGIGLAHAFESPRPEPAPTGPA